MKWMAAIIGKAYYWFWHDFVCRPEPYTYTLRRHLKKWWLLWVITVMGSAGFITWLLLHLGGFA